MSLFQNKYRIESSRLTNWDYTSAAAYFVTLCTYTKEHFFGVINNGEMLLNDIGVIVRNEWLQTSIIRPDMNLLLEEFIVMLNHFHAIIVIGQNEFNTPPAGVQKFISHADNNNPPIRSKDLSSIIRGFKSSVTTKTRAILPCFAWQERFHDHVIRNNEEYQRIASYIINNPANWENDKFY